jgi:hypothetical protein
MESESQESLESTDKFQPVTREAIEERPTPPRRPIPSLPRRVDAAPATPKTPAPATPSPASFSWPLSTAKPQTPGPWKPPAAPKATPSPRPITSPPSARVSIPPITAKPAAPATMAPLPRVPRATAPPPAAAAAAAPEPVVVHVPARVEPAPAPVVVAPAPLVVAPVAPVVVAPVVVAPVEPVREPEPVRAALIAPTPAPAAFGSSMLQSHTRKPKKSADLPAVDLPALGPVPTFGAGMLQARKGNGKLIVIAIVLAIASIGGLVVVRGGSSTKPAPAPTAQP